MRRLPSIPRTHWRQQVEEAGLAWHSADEPYWNESAYYELTARDVEVLESATNELAELALGTAQHIIDNQLYAELGIPAIAVPLIENSWKSERPSLYGRFDLAYDGVHPPKLLEYNADTPTSLLEAAVVQWYWLQDMFGARDQFNSIHQRLIACWKQLMPYLPEGRIDFCSIDDAEDGMTVTYLLDTAQQAGLRSSIFPIDEIGWNGHTFVGPNDQPLSAVFKLYPWEWMVCEEFGRHLARASTLWIEPPWKMLLSNKGMLPVIWDLYPEHPNLLRASFDAPGAMTSWVRKPMLGREGANITLHQVNGEIQTGGEYGSGRFVYQEAAELGVFDGHYSVVGSWVIGHEENNAAGVGIRESTMPIMTNTSSFVPHVIG
ncbi:MAG TPA: glutathionylspermidine synthase family protein [Bryobacteraceae bacterium]|jgi:glutathionylspermidine synthase|nr:glutathionylspermidine synthase family protein [Bryobacteraceae bacterium]